MARLRAALLYDDELRREANESRRNYWPVYYREVLERIGLPHEVVGPQALGDGTLGEYRTLLLPPLAEGYLGADAAEKLAQWVRAGGLLVGFATRGLDDLFGVRMDDAIAQPGDEFTPSACLRLRDEEWSVPLLPAGMSDATLPVLAPVQCVLAPGGRELARLCSLFERDLGRPGVVYRREGAGAVCYWAFDLAHCVWAMQQGRPVMDDYDGDGQLRSRDGIAIGPWRGDLPYADVMLFVLRRVLAEHGAVLLHQLPPAKDGSVPDALFHWGGDDCGWQEDYLAAAEFMLGLGLPYHINVQQVPAGNHLLSRETFERLREMGCEVGIQFRLVPPEGTGLYHFTREDLESQLRWHREAYGQTPVVTVFSRCEWTGWAEPARWLAELGMQGDNNRFGRAGPLGNPLNTLSFGFGTCYPFFYYEDWTRGNRRIPFTCQPITDYECGFRFPEDTPDYHGLHRSIDLAGFWNLTMNLFRHPYYIVRTRSQPEAVKHSLEYMAERGIRPVHLGSDEMCLWWHARSASAVEEVAREESVVTIRTRAEHASGCVVQLLVREGEPGGVEVEGEAAPYVVREQHGARWLYVPMPAGEATAVVRRATP